ncbi:MAG: BatA domain-containing protein [Gemmataceae bacterium]
MHAILLATAALVGLPILLHLILRQEPKRLVFPAIRFLQQKRRQNQRKLRLRHWLLMALRMLLIALFGLALYQPTLLHSGLINLAAEQPVACVIVVDTSASMGLVANGKTRLDEARRRGSELFDELPTGSRVAIVSTDDPAPRWELSLADARTRLDRLELSGTSTPLTAALPGAYALFSNLDVETDGPPLPRLMVLLTDRASAAWDATRTDDLAKLRDAVPAPAPVHAVFDVGLEKPTNVAITNLSFTPQLLPQGQPLSVTVTVAATGPALSDLLIIGNLPGATPAEQRATVNIPADGSAAVTLTWETIPIGVHALEVKLDPARPDNLAADNLRYATVRVAEPRKILTICDDPVDATHWQLAQDSVGEFTSIVQKPAEVTTFAGYAAVCLLNVADPGPLWPKLTTYVEQEGGQLLILPGGENHVSPSAYTLKNPAANPLLPATLTSVFDTESLQKRQGVPWFLDDAALRYPLLAPFAAWKLRGDVDLIINPRVAWKYWQTEPHPESTVIVRYDDATTPAERRPAVLERSVGRRGGKVMLMTTRSDYITNRSDLWNNYWYRDNNSWFVVMPILMIRSLVGNPESVNYQFNTGQGVTVPWPKSANADADKPRSVQWSGPGVRGPDATITVAPTQSEIRLGDSKTRTAGTYRLTGSPTELAGFSLNTRAEESVLTKVPAEAIVPLTGPNSIIPIERSLALREILATKFDQPLELFPWLLILVLFLLAGESVLASRFSRASS